MPSALMYFLTFVAVFRRPYPPLPLHEAITQMQLQADKLRCPAAYDNLLDTADHLVINFQSKQLAPYFDRHVSELHRKYGFSGGYESGRERRELFEAGDLYNRSYLAFRNKLWRDQDAFGHLTSTAQLSNLTHGVTKQVAINLRNKALHGLYGPEEPLVEEALPAKTFSTFALPDEEADNIVLQYVMLVGSVREAEVSKLLTQEKTRDDIAKLLGLSPNNVDKIFERLRHRLWGNQFDDPPENMGQIIAHIHDRLRLR
jgi:hypothetical protein